MSATQSSTPRQPPVPAKRTIRMNSMNDAGTTSDSTESQPLTNGSITTVTLNKNSDTNTDILTTAIATSVVGMNNDNAGRNWLNTEGNINNGSTMNVLASNTTSDTVQVEDSNAERHDLFIREIESIDEYWGPTFRTIYDSSEHSAFLDKLSGRIGSHDKDIERMCNHHYHGFIDSIHDLLTVREQATRLRAEVTRVDEEVQKSSSRVLTAGSELVKARKTSSNICLAVETLSACLPVLKTYTKLQQQIEEKRYYPALKTLEQLEHTQLPRVASYKFTEHMRQSIPRVREDIKAASMTQIKDFLEEVRRLSPRIGEAAMKQRAFNQLYNFDDNPSVSNGNNSINDYYATTKSGNTAKEVNGTNPFSSDGMVDAVYESTSESEEDMSFLGPEDLVDFSPVLRCLHIHTVLQGERQAFCAYYRLQRQEQARLALQPPNNMHEGVDQFRSYLHSVLGFFVVEEYLSHTAPGLVDKEHLIAVWNTAMGKVVNNIRNQTSYVTDTSLMLDIKKLLLLFARTLQTYGYSVSGIYELLLEMRDHYNEILMTQWLQVFRDVFDEDNYHPVTVDTFNEYVAITQVFPYEDKELEAASFPKQFPFSLMVPKVYSQVKNFIVACLHFSEDLSVSDNSQEDMVRRATNLLLTRTLSGCLASLIKRPGLGLLQLIQITINTLHLEQANTLLEQYLARITGGAGTKTSTGSVPTPVLTLGNLQAKAMFKDIRGEAEEQIYAALLKKLDQFLDLANYDWLLPEATGHSSSFVSDLIAFLNSTFAAFTNLPVRVAGTACMSACQHISRSLLSLILADSVRQIALPALEQLSLDILQCEQFAAGEPVAGLEEGALVMCFADLRQLLDLLVTEDWSVYLSEYGRGDAKFLRVSPATAAIIVEKLLEGERRGVFSRLKKSDKKKLLETVLRQLKSLINSQA